jgi:hypothetical protein
MATYRDMAGRLGRPNHASVALAAADTSKTLVAAKTNYTYYVQRLTYVPTVVNAQVITVRNITTTAFIIALIPASQSTPYVADFGDEGYPVTAGEGLEAVPGAAGPSGKFQVEGYYKLSSVIGTHASNQ